ncbi:claudin-14 [Nothoprocta perdicaria]|uniref:Claudin n=1 Tax=Nothoprocta perdicaria TaxID=30464 RepID=A0A8C6ZYG1_NOTPE|nr:claudin-14 [Nothoprocta perdicaria]
MAHMALQLLGFLLGLLGLLGTLVATLLPHWWRAAHAGTTILTAVAYARGLWMECVWHSTGVCQCRGHRSELALPPHLRAARALMVASCALAALACALAAVGMECTRCAAGTGAKRPAALAAGLAFALAGLFCLLPVAWTTARVVADFHGAAAPGGLKYDVGQAVYVGFAAAALSVLGGALLCAASLAAAPAPPRHRAPTADREGSRASSRAPAPHRGYRLRDYV